MFLSTDAGGTGLNLQAADTVINLELPWNPAVLEQRIARVHRMGQHRPVRVINLVTRDSIEERVLRTLEQKRSLFDGAVRRDERRDRASTALGQQAFLDAMRELFGAAGAGVGGEPAGGRPVPAAAADGDAGAGGGAVPGGAGGGAGGAGARVTTDPRTGQPALLVPLPSAELVQRAAAALRAILQALGRPVGPPP